MITLHLVFGVQRADSCMSVILHLWWCVCKLVSGLYVCMYVQICARGRVRLLVLGMVGTNTLNEKPVLYFYTTDKSKN